MACVVAQPRVDALETDLGARADVLRVSIHTEPGRALSERYDFVSAPLFIIFDAEGRVIRRGAGVPSVADVLQAVP